MNDDPQRGHRQHHRDFPIRISIIATSERRNVYGCNELSVMKGSSHNHMRTMNGRSDKYTDVRRNGHTHIPLPSVSGKFIHFVREQRVTIVSGTKQQQSRQYNDVGNIRMTTAHRDICRTLSIRVCMGVIIIPIITHMIPIIPNKKNGNNDDDDPSMYHVIANCYGHIHVH